MDLMDDCPPLPSVADYTNLGPPEAGIAERNLRRYRDLAGNVHSQVNSRLGLTQLRHI